MERLSRVPERGGVLAYTRDEGTGGARANPARAMEHSHPLTAFDAVRPWRTATIVASAIAAGELLLLVLLGIALLGKPLSEHADKAAAAKLAVPLPTTRSEEHTSELQS